MADSLQPTQVLSVSALNRMAREVLEQSFPLFWVGGEISNMTRAASGHWYFSLKDGGAQVRCVMFRGRNSYLDWTPKEGDKVEARATVTLYEARGDFQLTVEFLQRAGLGALYEAYERLKQQLEAEGLFDPARKQPIPTFPTQIGVVTSADAAALRDVLTTLKRRMPGIPVVIYPTPVQGKGVARLIAHAINTANQRAECDVLIVCRGGGSIEDLWQFNEEIVARAIANCSIPIISGVGHETDFTIADFAADQRAPTPTAAAEMAAPDRLALLGLLRQQQYAIRRQMEHQLHRYAQQLDFIARRLLSPSQQVAIKTAHLKQLQSRLQQCMRQQLLRQQDALIRLQNSLQHLNPNAVLSRGYALVHNEAGAIIHNSHQTRAGEVVRIQFAQGAAKALVESTNETVTPPSP